jgi:hypothetical protein
VRNTGLVLPEIGPILPADAEDRRAVRPLDEIHPDPTGVL